MYGIINPLSFRYEFDFWGKNRAMLEAALGHAAAEEAETAEVRLRLTTGIARAYFRGQALQQQLAIVKTIVRIRRDLRSLRRHDSVWGLITTSPSKLPWPIMRRHSNVKRRSAINLMCSVTYWRDWPEKGRMRRPISSRNRK